MTATKTRTTNITARRTTLSHDGNGRPVLYVSDSQGKWVKIHFETEAQLRCFTNQVKPLRRIKKLLA